MSASLAPVVGRRQLLELVRAAILAPSGHNTQPWRFVVEDHAIRIVPDFSRRLPIADPDDRELWISLGCALENLVLTARATGLDSGIDVFPDDAGAPAVRVALGACAARPDPLMVAAIPERQTTRRRYDGAPLSPAILDALEAASAQDDVQLQFLTAPRDRERALALVLEATRTQLADPLFGRELRSWLRFNASEARLHLDGLTTETLGMPSVPRWLGERMVRWSGAAQLRATAAMVRSSPALLVFSATRDEPEAWLNAGRSFERVALRATALGLRHAHLNAACEVPATRAALASELGLAGSRPMLLARVGRAPAMPRSPRRPLEMVVSTAEPAAY